MAFFVAHTMCCTLMVLSDELLLLDGWHFFRGLQMQKCSPQCCCHCIEIMMGKLMMCLDMLSSLLLELHNVSIFIKCFLYLTLKAMLSNGDICFIAGRFSTNILLESLLVSSILLPISFKESKYCWSISTAVNFCLFPLLIPVGCCSFHILVVTCTFSFQLFRIADFSFFWIGE